MKDFLPGGYGAAIVLVATSLLAWAGAAAAERTVLVEPLDARVVRTFLPGRGFQVVLAVSPVDCSADASKRCYRFGAIALRQRHGESVPAVLEVGGTDPLEGDVSVSVVPLEGAAPADPLDTPGGDWDGASSAPVYVDVGRTADVRRRFRDGALIEVAAEPIRSSPVLTQLPTGEGRVGRVVVAHLSPGETSAVRGAFSAVGRALAGNVPSLADLSDPTPILFLDDPAPASRQSIVVEPLHASFASPGRPGPVGLHDVPRARPVRVPAAECGGGDAGIDGPVGSVDCFEFVYGYVTHDSDDRQVVHVPDSDPSDSASAPISGSLDLRILPLDLDASSAEVFATWDGSRTSRAPVRLPTRYEGGVRESSYHLPVLRVPAEEIRRLDLDAAGRGGFAAVVLASHPDPIHAGGEHGEMTEEAFHAPAKRDVLFHGDVANRLDGVPVPVFFEFGDDGLDAREVVLLEPLHSSRLAVPGLPNFELPVVESTDHPELGAVYEFAVTYGVYGDDGLRLHQVGDAGAPLEGDLAVVVAGLGDSTVAVRRTWSASDLRTAALPTDLDAAGARSLTAARIQIRRADVRKALPKLPGSDLVVGSVRGEHLSGGQVSSGFYNARKRVAARDRESGNLLDVAPTPVLFR